MPERLDRAIAAELQRLGRSAINIAIAVEDGRIDEHDGIERTERAVDWCAKRLAFVEGRPRPQQRRKAELHAPRTGHGSRTAATGMKRER
jgi:hypothetical protein